MLNSTNNDIRGSGPITVEFSGVSKSFGSHDALSSVDMTVRAGEVVAVVGPNGAGKTTLVSILVGQRLPDAGTVSLLGANPRDYRARAALGATPQQIGFPPTLRVREIIELVQAHYDKPDSMSSLLSRFGLTENANDMAGKLSDGQKRRLAVALAFAGNPRVIVLDEPTTGLDVESRNGLWKQIRAFTGAGGSVLLTTHYLGEVEALASYVVMLSNGRIVAQGTVPSIRSQVSQVEIRFLSDQALTLNTADFSERNGNLHRVLTFDEKSTLTELKERGIVDVDVQSASLETAFLTLTGKKSE